MFVIRLIEHKFEKEEEFCAKNWKRNYLGCIRVGSWDPLYMYDA